MADFARSTDPRVQKQLDRLAMVSPSGDRLGLERIGVLLERLGRPQDALPPVFHLAGTNGKGSTVAFLRAILEAGGYRVHVFTSPHLVRFNERIRIAGTLISDDQLAASLDEVIAAGEDIQPSFFEVATAVAILVFARTPADACILEVGLGGRLDATNIIDHPLMCGIADLGLDHQQYLGTTLTEIAAEKAAIAKSGVPLVTQHYPPEAAERVAAIAGEKGAELLPRGIAWNATVKDGRLIYRDRQGSLDLPVPQMAGAHQPLNAGLAVAMLRHQDKLTIKPSAFDAIATAKWPARLQLLGPGPLTDQLPGKRIWLDGGHNHEAAVAIAQAMAPRAPFDLIFALLKNRNVRDVLGPLAPLVRLAQTVPIPGHESHDPRDIAAFAQEQQAPRFCYPAFTLEQAIERFAGPYADSASDDLLIFGSLYLAGEVLALNRELPD